MGLAYNKTGFRTITVSECRTGGSNILTEVGAETYNRTQIIFFQFHWSRPMQSQPKKVGVKFHSGYKGEETPRSVLFKDQELPIDQICARKRVFDPKTGEVREEYTIKMKGQTAVLKIYSSGDCELVEPS